MNKRSVLIVEEDVLKSKLRKFLLEEEDYLVRIAKNIEEAFLDLTPFNPHLILLDSQVPGGALLESLHRLKAHTKFENSKILVMILNASHQDEIWAKVAGFDGCIKNPIDPLTFVTHVGRHLKRGSEPSEELHLHFNEI